MKKTIIGQQLLQDLTKAQIAAETLKAVGHPIRLRIIAILCQGEAHVSGLCEKLKIPQSIVSQQLRILKSGGLVAVVRRDGFAFYRLTQARLKELIQCVEGCCQPFLPERSSLTAKSEKKR